MCPFDEQQLDQMLAKPMPKLAEQQFCQQTIDRVNNADNLRIRILQVTIVFALIALAYLFPGKELILESFSFNVFDVYEINFNQVNQVIMIASQLFMAAMLVFIFKDEI